MKKNPFLSLQSLALRFARPAMASLMAAGLVVPLTLVSAPVAAAATVKHPAATPATPAAGKKAKKAHLLKTTGGPQPATFIRTGGPQPAVIPPHLRKRVTFTMEPGERRAHVSRIAFSPTHSQAFRMREPEGSLSVLALRSNAALVVDQNTHEALYEKNSTEVMPIASISKLMTAMVVLDSKAAMDEVVEVTDADRDYEKNTGSRLSVGSRLSREDMLHIALMSSENRAAAALSRYFPGGRPAFVAAMNKKALELGMTNTHFLDPTGLSPNTSSASDLVKMVSAAYQYPQIREFSTDVAYDVHPGTRTLHYGSTNALVRNPGWQIGLQKTGFTNEAGECMVMQTTVRDRPVIMVLLDSVGKYSRVGDAERVHTWLGLGGVQRVTSAESIHAGT